MAGTALTDCTAGDGACAARRRQGERPGFVAGGIAICASACTLLLAAGTLRDVGENSYAGVHQITSKQAIPQVETVFRVLRRREGNRIVAVGRVAVPTRVVRYRTVAGRTPDGFYAEVARYFRTMGIGEAIMPLMHATLPSAIHWMSRAELAETHLANDTTDARTLLGRLAQTPASPGPAPSAMALATATLGTGPSSGGVVDWRVDRTATGPVLLGTVDIPGRNLHGTVKLRRETDPGATNGYTISVDFGPPAAIEPGRVWTTDAPRICDGRICNLPFAPAAARDDGQGRRDFGVIPSWGDGLLSGLRDKTWLTVGLTAADGRTGWISLSLASGARATIAAWEHLCCGLSPPAAETTAPDPAPDGPLQREVVHGDGDLTVTGPYGDAAPAPSHDRGDLTWRYPARPGTPPAEDLSGDVRFPAAGLSVALATAPAGRDHPGDLLVDLAVSGFDPTSFGPITSVSVATTRSEHGVPLGIDRVDKLADGRYRLSLAVPPSLGDGHAIRMMLGDGRGRLADLSLSIPGRVAVEILREAQRGGAGGS